MTAEKLNTDIFEAALLAEKAFGAITFQLYANGILYVHVPRYEKIDFETVKVGYAFTDEVGGGKFHNIYHFESFSDVDPEIREWAADPEGNLYTHTDAIVINNISQKIMADFYMKFNKPAKPTKVFFSLEKAVKWSIEKMND